MHNITPDFGHCLMFWCRELTLQQVKQKQVQKYVLHSYVELFTETTLQLMMRPENETDKFKTVIIIRY